MQKQAHPPGSAAHFPLGHIAHDISDSQSRLRGLVLRGPYSWCAYVGAPSDHFLSDFRDLYFKCHFGWNYDGPGDGNGLPAGYYWWGWDYAHFSDLHLPADPLPVEMQAIFDRQYRRRPAPKDWTCDEVHEHVLDVIIELRSAIQNNERLAASIIPNVRI